MPKSVPRPELMRSKATALRDGVLAGPGVTAASLRAQAAANTVASGALGDYIGLVHREATAVRDHHIAALVKPAQPGTPALSEEAVFELTVAAATGAGMARLQRVQALLAGSPQIPEVP